MSFAEQFDRNNFMQNIILGNMLIVDIYGKAKKHHIQEVPRVVFVIDTGSKNNDMAMELVKNLADIRSKDFVTCVDQHSIVLIKDVSQRCDTASGNCGILSGSADGTGSWSCFLCKV